MRVFLIVLMMVVLGAVGGVSAQDEDATPTETETLDATPAPDSRTYSEIDGQTVAVDYTITAGDILVTFVLVTLLFSVWGLGFVNMLGVVKHE